MANHSGWLRLASLVFTGVIVGGLGLVPAGAEVLISNLPGNDGSGTYLNGDAHSLDNSKAAGLTMPAGTGYFLDEVVLRLEILDVANNPVVQIWSDAGGLPDSVLITLINPTFTVGGIFDYPFAPPSRFELQADQTYWVVVFNDSPLDDRFEWYANSPPTAPAGVATNAGYLYSTGLPPPTGSSTFFNSYEVSGTVASFPPITEGLVAHYPFAGNALDSSGHENHPYSVTAQLTDDRYGQPNSAYRFNGGGNWIKIPDSPSLRVSDGLTIFAWVRPDSTESGYVVIKRDNICGGSNYDIDLFPGTLRSILSTKVSYPDCQSGTFSGGAIGATPVSVGVWHHIAVTWDKPTGDVILYLDGAVDGSGSYDPPQFNHTTGDLNIGHYYGAYGYSGVIDDVRIYDRALSQHEIQYLSSVTVFSDGFEVGDTSRWSITIP